jgi:hypothetical protein
MPVGPSSGYRFPIIDCVGVFHDEQPPVSALVAKALPNFVHKNVRLLKCRKMPDRDRAHSSG